MNNIKEISKFLKKLRQEHNYTLEEVSDLSNLSINTISMIEKGNDYKVSSLLKLISIYHLNFTDIQYKKIKDFSKLPDEQKQIFLDLITSFLKHQKK
ncbi:MAG: helix-turn-helix transcriptional regulator [Bacteroidetes bacterium]|nr:helix-turn-helix transcriptional regulator [Bacteroidota bacterium]